MFAKLRQFRDYVDVDAVVISHLHADHFLDLVPYSYALTYAPRQQPVPVDRWPGTDDPARPRLIAPPGARRRFAGSSARVGQRDLIENAFEIEEYAPSDELEIGPLRVRFQAVPHFTETFAMDLSLDERRRHARLRRRLPPDRRARSSSPTDADLLLVEATLPRPERTGIRGHLTPGGGGRARPRRGRRRLVLTHISDELDRVWARERGGATLRRPRRLAARGRRLRRLSRVRPMS